MENVNVFKNFQYKYRGHLYNPDWPPLLRFSLSEIILSEVRRPTVPRVSSVTESALLQRINRRLAHNDKQLHRSRGWEAEHNLGRYFIRDTHRNLVTTSHVDIESLAVELDVLADDEAVLW